MMPHALFYSYLVHTSAVMWLSLKIGRGKKRCRNSNSWMKPQGSQGCNAVYYLILTVFAQDLPVSTVSGIGGAFSTLLCIAGCCSICCYWYFKSDPRYTRRAAHANRNRRLTSHRSHPSMGLLWLCQFDTIPGNGHRMLRGILRNLLWLLWLWRKPVEW